MLTKRQYRVLSRFSLDKPRTLSYPLTGADAQLHHFGYIRPSAPIAENELNSDWLLTPSGQLAKENYEVYRRDRGKEDVRWLISTVIALAALLHSIFFRD